MAATLCDWYCDCDCDPEFESPELPELPLELPSTFGHRVFTPSWAKKRPMRVFGKALIPLHWLLRICVMASRKLMHPAEHEPPFWKSDA